MSLSRPRMRSWPALLVVVALAGYLVPPAAAARPAARPNIVLILTDDEDVASHRFMPKTKALVEDQGVAFDNFFVSYAFCCPSRTSILRGQYAHNTQVVGNELPYGGYEKLHQQGLENSTIATWLQAAGYRTALLGKYINRYEPELGVPPGWSDWYGGGTDGHQGYDYRLNENGRVVRYGSEPSDYATDVLAGKAVDVIERSSAAGQPFFLYVAPFTPHSPAVAARRHLTLFGDAELPRGPAFDEADVSDKPSVLELPAPPGACARLAGARIPAPAADAAGGRRHGRDHRWRAGRQRRARPDLRHLHLRQRLPHGRAPDGRRQEHAL